MIVIRTANGTALAQPNGIINDFTINWGTKTSIHKLPGANKDIVQKMGLSNRIFTFKGIAFTQSGSDIIQTCINATGSLNYSTIFGTGTHTIFYYDLQWQETGLRPLERHFTLNAVEII